LILILIYILTAVGLTPGGSITKHNYIQTKHKLHKIHKIHRAPYKNNDQVQYKNNKQAQYKNNGQPQNKNNEQAQEQ
jgi:hypothetical protein